MGTGTARKVTRDTQQHTLILPVPFVPSHARRDRPRHARHVQSRRAAQSRAARATVIFTLSVRIPLQLNGFADKNFRIYDTRGRVHYMLPTSQARGPPRQDAILLRPSEVTMRSPSVTSRGPSRTQHSGYLAANKFTSSRTNFSGALSRRCYAMHENSCYGGCRQARRFDDVGSGGRAASRRDVLLGGL